MDDGRTTLEAPVDPVSKPSLPGRPPLQAAVVSPVCVVVARRVEHAEGTLGAARATLRPDASGAAQIVWDFGQEVVGRAAMGIACDGSATVTLLYGEDLTEALTTADAYPEPNWYRLPADRLVLAEGAHQVTSAGRRAFRYLHLHVEGPGTAVQVGDVRVTTEHYPVRDDAGYFNCSDPLLNRAWDISRRTVKLCMQDFYEDGPKRDGILWVGDYRVAFLCNALLFGDRELARRSLHMMAATIRPDGAVPAAAVAAGGHRHGRPHGIDYMPGMSDPNGYVANWILENYCCDYVASVREYHAFTGDDATVRDLWPGVANVAQRLLAIDPLTAATGRKYITDCQPGEGSWWQSPGTLAMQLIAMARDAAALAAFVEDATMRRACERYVAAHTPRVSGAFFDKGRGVYCDRLVASEIGQLDASFGWHVNAAAVLAGVVGMDAAAAALLQRVSSMPDARRPMAGFQMFWTLEALCRSGSVTEALSQMRRYYGHMLAHDATTCWDVVDVENANGIDRPTSHAMSHCHAWSAAPAYVLPAHVLGVHVVAPGMQRLRIRPYLGDLDWAGGTVPTPTGDVQLHWERRPARGERALIGSVTLPEGVDAELVLPGDDVPHRLHAGTNCVG